MKLIWRENDSNNILYDFVDVTYEASDVRNGTKDGNYSASDVIPNASCGPQGKMKSTSTSSTPSQILN